MSVKEATVLTKTKPLLLSHEAQCISNVLKNCIRQVEIAATLPAVLQLNSVSSVVVNKELSRAIKEHQLLDGRMKTLDGLKQMSDGEQEGEVGKARAQLEKDIKNSVRDLLRAARGHADVMCALRAELGMQVGESESMLIKGLEKFHSQVVEKLLTSPDDELQHVLYKRVYSIHSHNLEKIATEGVAVATDMMEIDAQISQGNDTIKQLQRSLIGNRQEPDVPHLAEKLSQSHVKSSKIRQTSIQQEIAQLNSQLNSLILKNREVEREIQEKNEKVKTEIEDLLQTFDNEMEEMQSNLELKVVDYEREEEELRKLEKPFSVLEVECNQIQEKRRLAGEKRREEMRELELKTKAAILAQAWWRGHSTRKSLKNKAKGKKAKKGEKAKKGGKTRKP
ncbi:dynein regulatory complex protein 10 [Cyclopterus lumpus]|uniref:dynein regulatory complex protein 10 n=1 Tax=Cyclopterus lumpus TaxID=8103 RepID=UPI001486107E|nr:dynein regulatory complex protein 10 [Cyclopterus lumpus]